MRRRTRHRPLPVWSAAAALWAVAGLAAPPAAPIGAAKPLPGLLEPYSGFDVVFGPGGPRVLGPEANPQIEAMLFGPGKELGGGGAGSGGCELGNVRVEASRLLVEVQCPDEPKVTVPLQVRERGVAAEKTQGTTWFTIAWPAEWQAAAAGPAQDRHRSAQADLLQRVQAKEGLLTWQRVRPAPGSPTDGWMTALLAAQTSLATGELPGGRRALAQAKALRPWADLRPSELFDFAILAYGLGDQAAGREAVDSLVRALAAAAQPTPQGYAGNEAADLRALAAAVPALAGDPTAAVAKASACLAPPGCDLLPVVRALAATRAFAQAAAVLDGGPLAGQAKVPFDLLKVRFGMASALDDFAGELTIAERMTKENPELPQALDLRAAGLGRAGRYRESIEILHDLSKRYPDRDIVLGRIAGLLAFLTAEALQNPAKVSELQAVEQRMREAAKEATDVVARFIVATRGYYAGKFEQALPELQALAQTGNRDPRIPLYLAMTFFWTGKQAEAESWIDRAVSIGPSDPDVFYCRSQIVRRVDVPLAIQDLERYEAMTKQPWAVGPRAKSQRVEAELALMRKGRIPPDWDKPGPDRAVFLPAEQTGTAASPQAIQGRAVAATAQGAAGAALADSHSAAEAANQAPSGQAPASPPWTLIGLGVAGAAALGLRLYRWKRN